MNGNDIKEQIISSVWGSLRDSLSDSVRGSLDYSLDYSLINSVRVAVYDSVRVSVMDSKEILAEMDKKFGHDSYLRFKLWFLFHDTMKNPSEETLYEINYIKNF